MAKRGPEGRQAHEVQWTAGEEIVRELVKRTFGPQGIEIELSRNENPPFIASATARIAGLRGLKVITRLAPLHYPIDKLSPTPPTQQIELQLHQYQKEEKTPPARVIMEYNPQIGDVLIKTCGLGRGVLHRPTRWSNLMGKDIGKIAERLGLPEEDLARFFQESILLTSPLARRMQIILNNLAERLTKEGILVEPHNPIITLPQNQTILQEVNFTLHLQAQGGDYLAVAKYLPPKAFNKYTESGEITLLHLPLWLLATTQSEIDRPFFRNRFTNPSFLKRYTHLAAKTEKGVSEPPYTTFVINQRRPEKRIEMDAHTLHTLTGVLAETAESLIKRKNVART